MSDKILREKIADLRISGEISHTKALEMLKNHTTFMFEDFLSIIDLSGHLYKLVDANLMPYKVMYEIMMDAENYYSETWR